MKIKIDDDGETEFTYLDNFMIKNVNNHEDKLGFLIDSYSRLIQILISYKKLKFDDLKEILFLPTSIEIIEEDW